MEYSSCLQSCILYPEGICRTVETIIWKVQPKRHVCGICRAHIRENSKVFQHIFSLNIFWIFSLTFGGCSKLLECIFGLHFVYFDYKSIKRPTARYKSYVVITFSPHARLITNFTTLMSISVAESPRTENFSSKRIFLFYLLYVGSSSFHDCNFAEEHTTFVSQSFGNNVFSSTTDAFRIPHKTSVQRQVNI